MRSLIFAREKPISFLPGVGGVRTNSALKATAPPRISAWPDNPSMAVSAPLQSLRRQIGDMFGCLRLYEDVGNYRKYGVVEFDALYENGQYVVFAVADVDTVQGMGRYAPFMQLPGMEARQRAACIEKLQAYSRILSPIQQLSPM